MGRDTAGSTRRRRLMRRSAKLTQIHSCQSRRINVFNSNLDSYSTNFSRITFLSKFYLNSCRRHQKPLTAPLGNVYTQKNPTGQYLQLIGTPRNVQSLWSPSSRCSCFHATWRVAPEVFLKRPSHTLQSTADTYHTTPRSAHSTSRSSAYPPLTWS